MADKTLLIASYRDELGPAYTHSTGGGTTAMVALAGGLSAIRGLTFQPGDYIDCIFQINHDILIPPSGNVTLHPHVHWTCVAAPANGATVIWEFLVFGAKPTLVTTAKGSAVAFPTSYATYTTPTFVCDGNETRLHLLQDMGDIEIPYGDYGSSYVLWGTLRMKSTATVAANKVALLSFDLHKMVQQFGSATEYV